MSARSQRATRAGVSGLSARHGSVGVAALLHGGSGESQWQLTWQRFREQRLAMASLALLAMICLACVIGPALSPWGATEMDMSVPGAAGPSLDHPLGTDTLGRDQLTRLLVAGRVSLLVGLAVSLAGIVIGGTVGIVAGSTGGRVDSLLMWIVNVMLSIPGLPLLITLAVLVANPHSQVGAVVRAMPETLRIIVVLSALSWMGVSRVIRSRVLAAMNQQYVDAARSLGMTQRRLMARHVLPDTVPLLVVFASMGMGGAIMAESFLSFLGMGVSPPTPTWGNMINHANELTTLLQFPWLVWTPAIAIATTVLCVNFLGEGLRNAIDGQRSGN